MVRSILISFLVFFTLSSCGVFQRGEIELYRDGFLDEVGKIKTAYAKGDSEFALNQLQGMDESIMRPAEKAMRRNLMGVILFSKKSYEQAIFNFELADSVYHQDKALSAQIKLNLASTYYKLTQKRKAFNILSDIDFVDLLKREQKKYHKLRYTLGKELGQESEALDSLIFYLGPYQSLSELRADPYFEIALTSFFRLEKDEREDFLNRFEEERLLVSAYLGYLEAEKRYYQGEKESAKLTLDQMRIRYQGYPEIQSLIESFFFRSESSTRIDPRSIGVILPLSGEKKSFGERALLGIDHGLRKSLTSNKNFPFELHIKDSKGSGAVGSFQVKELVEKRYVSAIIGGLFSSEAVKEYLEAKKRGVLFISLSPIYLPREQKDHLLIEVPGSVESQVNRILSEDMLEKFGKKAAIVYPNSIRGEAYVDEFWNRSQALGVEVVGALSFEKDQSDYREPIKKLLGLRFTRERQEELEIYEEIYALEKNRSTRRLQTLRPQIDFDWVFMPALPKEALQIIPSFGYFDAFGLSIIGGPSWRSQTLSRESYKLGRLNFVGGRVEDTAGNFTRSFIEKYQRRPRLIEMRAFDSINLVKSLVGEDSFSTRDELDISIRSQERLKGLTGDWNLNSGVWIKEMLSLTMSKGKIQGLFAEDLGD